MKRSIFTTVRNKTLSKAIILALLLQGCATNQTAVETKLVDQWHLKGKIAMVYPKKNCNSGDCSPRSDQGGIDWKQNKQNYLISLSDPFGRMVITIDGDSEMLSYKTPKQPLHSASPQAFVNLLIGDSTQKAALADLTPTDLQYWVTGRPVPRVQHRDKEKGVFEQKGYQIQAKQWRGTAFGNMPSLIVIKKGQFVLRLVIKEWSSV